MKTRTGNFAIGFRRGGGKWQKDLDGLIAWAKENDLSAIDVGGADDAKRVAAAGLRVGTVNLRDSKGMIAKDAARRADAIAANREHVAACAELGPVNHFVVMLPEDPGAPRDGNFGYMVESYAALAGDLEKHRARIAIEGWPGPGALCCTPETLSELFRRCPSEAMGINYDPSHLVRMGIDPLRFLREFAPRVAHVHGKDTELLSERQYQLGREQPATFAERIAFGGTHWRYTIPGHGVVRWGETFRLLAAAGYAGCVCVELEDANFNGTEEGERLGILAGANFLASC
jgi:sugar phosphate isomerase/epimerase